MFLLIYVTVNIVLKMSSCGSNAGMETPASQIDAFVNKALFNSNSHINQIPPQIVHTLCFYSGRLVAPDFAMKCIEVSACYSVASSLEVHTGLLHYCTFGLEAE